MKYRITEFKSESNEGFKFFVETGKDYYEKYWAFIYLKKTTWSIEKDDRDNVLGYKTIEEALNKIDEIKNAQPIYHEIK